MTDTNGNEKESGTYKPYGEGTTGNLTTKYRWTGGETDQSGLYYFNARYYSPETGRFISVDPAVITKMDVDLSIEEICNPYMYARNNPIRYTDPTGLVVEWIQGEGVSDEDYARIQAEADDLMNSDTEAGSRYKELYDDPDVLVRITVTNKGGSTTEAINDHYAGNGTGSGSYVNIDVTQKGRTCQSVDEYIIRS